MKKKTLNLNKHRKVDSGSKGLVEKLGLNVDDVSNNINQEISQKNTEIVEQQTSNPPQQAEIRSPQDEPLPKPQLAFDPNAIRQSKTERAVMLNLQNSPPMSTAPVNYQDLDLNSEAVAAYLEAKNAIEENPEAKLEADYQKVLDILKQLKDLPDLPLAEWQQKLLLRWNKGEFSEIHARKTNPLLQTSSTFSNSPREVISKELDKDEFVLKVKTVVLNGSSTVNRLKKELPVIMTELRTVISSLSGFSPEHSQRIKKLLVDLSKLEGQVSFLISQYDKLKEFFRVEK